MLKTIELMLGLTPLTLFDLVATDMRASFIGPDEIPNFEPYTAIQPQQSLFEVNQRVGAITGPHAAERRQAALASARMNFREPDEGPSERVDPGPWPEARGGGAGRGPRGGDGDVAGGAGGGGGGGATRRGGPGGGGRPPPAPAPARRAT